MFPFQVPHLRLYYGWHKHINYINNGNLSNDSSTEERTLVVVDEMHPSNFKMPSQENITSLTAFPPGKDTFFITYLNIISCDNGWYQWGSINQSTGQLHNLWPEFGLNQSQDAGRGEGCRNNRN